MAIFYLVRHGVTEWNRQRRIQGQLDIALTKEGREQARRAGQALMGKGIEYIYTSDLGRARETAQLIAEKLQLPIAGTRRELREIDFGRWEGMTLDEIKEKEPEAYALRQENMIDTPTPGGESFRMMAERSLGCIQDLAARHPHDKIAVVTHGGPIIYILGAIEEENIQSRPLYKIANCSITIIGYNHDGDGWQVLKVNDTRHLDTP
ncbi:MAG: histidine phosphatase family protein [Firmicutes bacterium]|nr:histidine phosphatase family protein [Bacillota bacterium]